MNYNDEYKHMTKKLHERMEMPYNMNDLPYLAGMIAMKGYLKNCDNEECKMVNEEMKGAWDYLHKFETTKNPMYLHMAKDEFKHFKMLGEKLKDEEVKKDFEKKEEMLEKEIKKHEEGQGYTQGYPHNPQGGIL